MVTHKGEIVHARVRELMDLATAASATAERAEQTSNTEGRRDGVAPPARRTCGPKSRLIVEECGDETRFQVSGLFVFMLSAFIGIDVIRRVSRLLRPSDVVDQRRSPRSRSSGRCIVTGEQQTTLSAVLGAIAVFASMTNIVSGFLITDRMLKMFRKREPSR